MSVLRRSLVNVLRALTSTNLTVLRPGDANEVVEARRVILQLRHRPAVLALSRQPLSTLDRRKYTPTSGVARGAFVLAEPPSGTPEVVLTATGRELSLARLPGSEHRTGIRMRAG